MIFEMGLVKRNDTHPLCLNRMQRAFVASRAIEGSVASPSMGTQLLKQAEVYLDVEENTRLVREMGLPPMMTGLSREDVCSMINKLATWFSAAGIDLNSVLTPRPSAWRDYVTRAQPATPF